MKSKFINIKEFAKIAGYSTATISRAFANHKNVKTTTKGKIMELARSHNFRPNLAARASFGSPTQSVGVLIGSLTTSYFADIVAGIQRVLLPKGYLPVVLDRREDTERNAIRRLIDHRVDGMIISVADQSLTDEEIKELAHFDIPVVMLDKRGTQLFSCVYSDDLCGGRLAGEHLLSLGHTRIGFAYVGEFGDSAEGRLEGLRQALRYERMAMNGKDVISFYDPDIPMMEGLAVKIERSLARHERPTAFYAYNDKVAAEIIKVASRLGLRVPDDLSVIGHSDLNFASMMNPALTTIRQDGAKTGQVAASMLLEKQPQGMSKDTRVEHVVVPVKFVKRQSTGTCSRKC